MIQKYIFSPPKMGFNDLFYFGPNSATFSTRESLAPVQNERPSLVTYFDVTTLKPLQMTPDDLSMEDKGLVVLGDMKQLIDKMRGYEGDEIVRVVAGVCKQGKLAHFLLGLEALMEPALAQEAMQALERMEEEFRSIYRKPSDVGHDDKVKVVNRYLGEPNDIREAVSILWRVLQNAWAQLRGDKSKFVLPFLYYEGDEAAAEKWHERINSEPALLDAMFQAAQIQSFLEKMGLEYKKASYRKPIFFHEAFRVGLSNCETSTELFLHFALMVGLDVQIVKSPGHALVRLGEHDLGVEGTNNFQLRTLSGNYNKCRFAPVRDVMAMRLFNVLLMKGEDHRSEQLHEVSCLLLKLDPLVLERKISFLLREGDIKGAAQLVRWFLVQQPDFKFSMVSLATAVLSLEENEKRERCNAFMFRAIPEANWDMVPLEAYMHVNLLGGDVSAAERFRQELLRFRSDYRFDMDRLNQLPHKARELGVDEDLIQRTIRYLEVFK